MARISSTNRRQKSLNRVLFVAQSQAYIDMYFLPIRHAVSRAGAALEVAIPASMEKSVSLPPNTKIRFFPDFDLSEKNAFGEAHRWNVLLNRKRSRSFLYRSKTVFPTWRVALLKISKDIHLRYNKIRHSESPPQGFSSTWTKQIRFVRLRGGWLFASVVMLIGSIRAPVRRLKALLKLRTRTGRTEILALVRNSPESSRLFSLMAESQPNLVVVPSLGHEIIPTDAIRAASRLATRSLLLVDNWDNLSSKSIFATLPDFVGTWGPQSSNHAVAIQGMAPERVFSLGAPRFESHFSIAAQRQKPPENQLNYVLYCGTSMYSKEDRVLDLLDQIFGRNGIRLPIVYRPHPQRFQKPGRVLRNQHGLVKIDASTDSRFWGNLLPWVNPSGNSLPDLLAGSVFVLGGLTSVLLEAELVGKRYCALAHHEIMSYSSPRVVFKTYDHYRGIETLPHLTLCQRLDDLERIALDHLKNPRIPGGRAHSTKTRARFLAGESSASYRQNLSQAISEILGMEE